MSVPPSLGQAACRRFFTAGWHVSDFLRCGSFETLNAAGGKQGPQLGDGVVVEGGDEVKAEN